MEYTKLGQIAKIQTGPFGSQLHQSDYKPSGIPCIMPCNIGSNLNIICDNIAYISEEDLNRLAKHKTQEGDIVYSRRGDIEKCAYISSRESGWLCGTGCLKVSIDSTIALPKYVAYLLSTPESKAWLVGNAVGTTMLNLNTTVLSDFPICLPDLDTQQKVVEIIDSIADKIELNKRINDNLEQQASSLLSDWISTYPCRTYKLSDICKYANAKCETGNLTPQNYISTENMLPNKKGIVEASNIPTGKATCYKVDDILIANIRPYFQKIWKADINGGCSADVLCIRANIESHSPILYWLLHQDAFFEYVMTGAKGCKMPRGDKQHIMNWSIDLPEVQYWADLATQLGSIDQQIAYNRIESINLSNLRDSLLPKLMSGEIKINEIDC